MSDDGQLAAELAQAAGAILLEVRRTSVFNEQALGKAGDQTANQFLIHALRHARPDDGLLSEESKDTPERLGKDRVWIIDPVDGTREYGEGRTDWAVHIALAVGGVPAIGAVALPGLGVVLRSDSPTPLLSAAAIPRMVVSRTRPAKEALAVAETLAPNWSRWAAPGPRRWRWSAARPKSISTPAVSTNGTVAPRSPSRSPTGCMRPESTAPR